MLSKIETNDRWRIQLRQRRAQLSLIEQQHASQRVVNQLLAHPLFINSQHIAGYLASEGEINMQALFESSWQQAKVCYLPTVLKQTLVFTPYQSHTSLIPNRWGILEPHTPTTQTHQPLIALDLVLLPLIAFDAQGHRLGRGAGYYDRSFSFLLMEPKPTRPYMIGLAYDWQRVDSLLAAAWDVPLDAIVTDKKCYLVR